MNVFSLELHGATRQQTVAGVTSFVGEDASGQFGILPRHDRMATVLILGMARYRVEGRDWRYLALPGATLHFDGDTLRLAMRYFTMGDDYRTIGDQLSVQMLAEEQRTERLRENLGRLERAMLRHLWQVERP